ncbi:MAG: class I SAM-dependent methyltransferase [Lachnospiraceae bacterium]|jgi:hypothetical protein|nr:class I SAM-dependent methyltransferase [Lachnospiraceae bacterium]
MIKKAIKKICYKILQFDPTIKDIYCNYPPSNQTPLDIFKGEWASILPKDVGADTGGYAKLFDDDRIKWVISNLDNLKNYRVLELGPLEGAHTYMLANTEAESVTAIEANSRAYLKCLVIKELLGLKKAQFLYGNVEPFLEQNEKPYDLILASGILYHMANPIKLIYEISKNASKVFIWTHFYDEAIIKEIYDKKRFEECSHIEHSGFKCKVYKQNYNTDLTLKAFYGGNNVYSYWMEKDDIVNCLKHFGFLNIKITGETMNHQNGPCFSVLAEK